MEEKKHSEFIAPAMMDDPTVRMGLIYQYVSYNYIYVLYLVLCVR